MTRNQLQNRSYWPPKLFFLNHVTGENRNLQIRPSYSLRAVELPTLKTIKSVTTGSKVTGASLRKLPTTPQARAKVCPTREFPARGRQESQVKSCQPCQVENKTCSRHPVQPRGTRRQNWKAQCEILMNEAQKDWIVFREPMWNDKQNEIFKPDLVFRKGDQVIAVDVTMRCESPHRWQARRREKWSTITTLLRHR